uniref:Hepatitis A virus cellular receptor 2 homolog n=1 Tax=Haplochromis burtoni TaxID=8153 RepID=A0A3Q3BXR6_HAPBU
AVRSDIIRSLTCVSAVTMETVVGHTGQDVTLPCKYDRKYHGALSACWQRGEIPTRGCSNQLISTDGLRVLTRASSRYELLGRLEDGDVALTIMNLTEGDAGRYGCRVEIPGPFNDDKQYIDLTVVDDPSVSIGCHGYHMISHRFLFKFISKVLNLSFSTGSLSLSTGSRCDDETDALLSQPSGEGRPGSAGPVQLHGVHSAAAELHRGQHLPDGERR